MEIILFGQLADIASAATCRVEEVQDTVMLKAKLESMFPGLEKVKYMLAVNKKMVQENLPLSGNETIALMPPFSGG
jgi:sulfur-carrier protein